MKNASLWVLCCWLVKGQLGHVSTDIRCGQWETLSNKRAGQQNYTTVQLEKSFLTFSGSIIPGRRRGCYWGRWPVKQRERHRDLVIHTSTKDLMISFQGLLLQKALWHGKQAWDPSLLPHKNWGVVQKKNRIKSLILPSNLGISGRSGKTRINI